jgi:hypothetical protein
MIEEHIDPTAEAHAQLSDLLRTLVTAAAGMADKAAQRRAAEEQAAARAAEAERRAFQERIDAERQTAFLAYRRVHDDRWWDTATPENIHDAVLAAGTWARSDPRADDAWLTIGDRLAGHYGIDLEGLARRAREDPEHASSVPAVVHGQVAQAQRNAPEAQAARQAASAVPPQDRWKREVTAVASGDLGAQILGSEGWPRLQDRLDKLQGVGKDPAAELRRAIGQREMDTAVDKAITLSWRLKETQARSGGEDTAKPTRQASAGAPPPGQPSAPETNAARFAKKQAKHNQAQRDAGPESASGR